MIYYAVIGDYSIIFKKACHDFKKRLTIDLNLRH